jgi:hypothetical protein
MHSGKHDDYCVLFHAGELGFQEAASFAKEAASCPQCRQLLESLSAASGMARAAAVFPSPGLNTRLIATAAASGPAPSALSYLWKALWVSALATAAFLLCLWPGRRDETHLRWSNGLDHDIARVDMELKNLSRSIIASSDAVEIDAEIRRLETAAKSLKQQSL